MSSQSGWGLACVTCWFLCRGDSVPERTLARAFHFIRSSAYVTTRANSCTDAPPRTPRGRGERGLRPGVGRRTPSSLGIATFSGLTEGYGFHVLALSRAPLFPRRDPVASEKLDGLPSSVGIELETHIVAHSLIGRDERILQAESPQVFQAYGLTAETPQALFFIRPDGYIAYRTDSLDVEGLGEFIRQRFGESSASASQGISVHAFHRIRGSAQQHYEVCGLPTSRFARNRVEHLDHTAGVVAVRQGDQLISLVGLW